MLIIRSILYWLLQLPIHLLVRVQVIADDAISQVKANTQASAQTNPQQSQQPNPSQQQPIFYVVRHQSASDLLTLKKACATLGLPDPLSKVNINGNWFYRTLCLSKSQPLCSKKQPSSSAIKQGLALLAEHSKDPNLNAQLLPANVIWGRTPSGNNKLSLFARLPANIDSPSWLRKAVMVLLLGRHAMVRFSNAIAFRQIVDDHGCDHHSAQKLIRITRVHFHRQILALTGPRLLSRQQIFKQLQSNPAVKKAISEHAQQQKLASPLVEQQALKIMKEIAGNYSDSTIRLGEIVLSWLWNKLYQGICVNNVKPIRQLAQQGHEIVYLPCHRSHMDYLLLTYVIYQQGLAPPRTAAGINLNFWPAGPIFRKAGAFFIRRSFKGEPLYATIFREYLSLLFERGYPVKFYTEGGRSRTGRLLPPKVGMFTMTLQSVLRGINRPICLVPVYIGYEHVMEVASYHKELSGSSKKSESLLGVVKAIKNLRNYGKGYVNFGQPININKFLNQQVPNWRDDIDPLSPQKPTWLSSTVQQLSQQVMTNINQNAAINGVALVALILHNSKNNALDKQELLSQLDFFLRIQRAAPFSKQLSLPTECPEQLLSQVILLNKVSRYTDDFGDVISLTANGALDMRYYRNNIIHCYLVHAIVCRLLNQLTKIHHNELINQVTIIFSLSQKELFLAPSKAALTKQINATLAFLSQENLAQQSAACFWRKSQHLEATLNLHSMGECVHETLQRLMIIITLVRKGLQSGQALNQQELTEQVTAIATRLALLSQANAPEFVDKKAQQLLISAMHEQGYLQFSQNNTQTHEQLERLNDTIAPLISTEVLQHIVSA